MKHFLILALLFLSCPALGMIKQGQKTAKEFSKEGKLTIALIDRYNEEKEVSKTVVVVTPTAMSKAKAETYFRKHTKALNVKAKALVDLTISLMQNNETGAVEYEQDPEHARSNKGLFLKPHWNKVLFALLVHPDSKFTYKAETNNIFLERDLGGNKGSWYFTEQLEVTHNDILPHKGLCSPLTLQCHHDKTGVHDKIWVSELERFYAESELPQILVVDNGVPFSFNELEKEGMIAQVKTPDERLRTIALLFVSSHKPYKQLLKKK